MFLRRFTILSEHCATCTGQINKSITRSILHILKNRSIGNVALAHPSVVKLMCKMVNHGALSHVLHVPEVPY